eukprot:PhF_6_TR10651/c0_g1_i1/m.17241
MNSIKLYFRSIFIDNKLPLEQKWRNTFCILMTLTWTWIVFDLCVELFKTSTLSTASLIRKCSNIWLLITLPFGLMLAYYSAERRISDKVMTYIVQCTAVSLSSGTLIISPTR